MAETKQPGLTEVEHIKARSNYLRGTIAEGLQDGLTGALAEAEALLLSDIEDDVLEYSVVDAAHRASVPGGDVGKS